MENQLRTMISSIIRSTVSLSLLFLIALVHAPAEAANENSARRAQVVNHWTAERRAAAIPRDLVIDSRGLGYLRRADGSLVPHGHQISAANDARPVPQARPGGGGGGGSVGNDAPPVISNLDPNGGTIGESYTFSATVTDDVGVRSVTFVFTYPDGSTTESFSASNSGGDTWSLTVYGFTNGDWSWRVEARDTAKRGGNAADPVTATFTVDTGGSHGGGNGGAITNSEWEDGGAVQGAAGRLFFEMPNNSKRKGPWTGYVCSGTVINDGSSPRSLILTASHCVYDDANKAFARNVLFIPDQANTSGDNVTDSNCGNDPIGCWVAAFGVVDVNWTTSVFPNNIPWDYAFYVVSDTNAHTQGLTQTSSDTLDLEVQPMMISFGQPAIGDDTFGMGYSYSDDPNFMYCAEGMSTEGSDNWWLPSCGLSGGSSGGPWLQPPNAGNGTVISVNSWGYTTSPGMAGPKLWGTSAELVMCAAKNETPSSLSDGDAGFIVGPYVCP